MRKITDHQLTIVDRHVDAYAVDQAGEGGACSKYEIRVLTTKGVKLCEFAFQDGAVGSPEDINGITNEALLAIVIDRLRGFQGELAAKTGVTGLPCKENARALDHLDEAMNWLRKRTLDRMARGV